jgi:hypothetical protein
MAILRSQLDRFIQRGDCFSKPALTEENPAQVFLARNIVRNLFNHLPELAIRCDPISLPSKGHPKAWALG